MDTITAEELEASIAADPGDLVGKPDWSQAVVVLPARKDPVNLRADYGAVTWFRARGKGYQSLFGNKRV